MLLKGIFGILLFVSIVQVYAYEKKEKTHEFSGESSDLLRTEGSDFKQKKAYDNKYEYGKVNKDYKKDGKYEKDYKKWDKKSKHDYHLDEHQKNHMKENEIESQEFVDKYNKYGKTFNPNHVNKGYKKHKEFYHDKHGNHLEKPKSLMHDTDVNYVSNHKKMDVNSELISKDESPKSKEKYEENYQNQDEVFEKRSKKNAYLNVKSIDLENPPLNDTALLARYIVHTVDWSAMATMSSRNPASPFACVKSMSDGPVGSSSGVPYFYMSALDLCVNDLAKNTRVSVLATLTQTEYCKTKAYDPQDPRCAKVMISGKIKWLESGSEEEKFAKNAMFTRHPVMESWPVGHNFRFSKMDMDEILLLYKFGGPAKISLKDYFNAKSLKPVTSEVAMP